MQKPPRLMLPNKLIRHFPLRMRPGERISIFHLVCRCVIFDEMWRIGDISKIVTFLIVY